MSMSRIGIERVWHYHDFIILILMLLLILEFQPNMIRGGEVTAARSGTHLLRLLFRLLD